MSKEDMQRIGKENAGFAGRGIYMAGGVAAIVFLVYSIATFIQVSVLGGAPATAQECFDMLNNNRIVGLLRLDIPTICMMPLYYVLFFGIYAAFPPAGRRKALLWIVFAFIGITLFLATPSAFSMVALSGKFAAATTDAMRERLLAAGEAVFASDMYHGTGAVMGGILLQGAALAVSVIMLRGSVFGRLAAWVGIAMYGLDLLHIFVSFIRPGAAYFLMMAAGVLYLLWFPLIARGFFKAYRQAA